MGKCGSSKAKSVLIEVCLRRNAWSMPARIRTDQRTQRGRMGSLAKHRQHRGFRYVAMMAKRLSLADWCAPCLAAAVFVEMPKAWPGATGGIVWLHHAAACAMTTEGLKVLLERWREQSKARTLPANVARAVAQSRAVVGSPCDGNACEAFIIPCVNSASLRVLALDCRWMPFRRSV
jgi:hypothetical protein